MLSFWRFSAISLAILAAWAVPVSAFNVGTSGNLYPITEKSIKEIVMERAKTFDFEEFKKKEGERLAKQASRYRLPDAVSGLPAAKEEKMVRVDLSFTSERDLTLPDGRVLYRRGTVVNPLEILAAKDVYYPKKLVVINGERPEEVRWLKEQFKGDLALNVLVTDGYPLKLRQELGRPVFNLRADMALKFRIEETPSVSFQPYGEKFFVTRTFVVEDDAVVQKQAEEDAYKVPEADEVEVPDFGKIEF